jgi:1,4-dihydroxy-6-naphthoate synthase
MRPLQISISPDADDLFMAWALIEGRIDLGGERVEVRTADTHALNLGALAEGGAAPDVTAISVAWYPRVAARYQLLPHSGSVGRGYGPVLVAPPGVGLDQLRGARIAVPGRSTSAFTVLSLMLPPFQPVVVPIVPPHAVFQALADGEVAAALLIHEGRLTYDQHGLHLLADLGAWWAGADGLPLPLGACVIRRDLGPERVRRVSALLRESVAYALAHRDEAIGWLLARGGPLRTAAEVDAYLRLYANDDSLDYGEDGRASVEALLRRGAAAGLLPPCPPVDWAP